MLTGKEFAGNRALYELARLRYTSRRLGRPVLWTCLLLCTMVLILDGISKIGGHVLSKTVVWSLFCLFFISTACRHKSEIYIKTLLAETNYIYICILCIWIIAFILCFQEVVTHLM